MILHLFLCLIMLKCISLRNVTCFKNCHVNHRIVVSKSWMKVSMLVIIFCILVCLFRYCFLLEMWCFSTGCTVNHRIGVSNKVFMLVIMLCYLIISMFFWTRNVMFFQYLCSFFFCFVWLFWCCILLDMLCFEKTVLWTIGLVFQNFG